MCDASSKCSSAVQQLLRFGPGTESHGARDVCHVGSRHFAASTCEFPSFFFVLSFDVAFARAMTGRLPNVMEELRIAHFVSREMFKVTRGPNVNAFHRCCRDADGRQKKNLEGRSCYVCWAWARKIPEYSKLLTFVVCHMVQQMPMLGSLRRRARHRRGRVHRRTCLA